MKTHKRIVSGILVFLGLFWGALVGLRAETIAIAVLPFQSDLPAFSGELPANTIEEIIIRRHDPKIKLVDRQNIERLLKEQALLQAGVFENANQAAEVCRMLKADVIIVGHVGAAPEQIRKKGYDFWITYKFIRDDASIVCTKGNSWGRLDHLNEFLAVGDRASRSELQQTITTFLDETIRVFENRPPSYQAAELFKPVAESASAPTASDNLTNALRNLDNAKRQFQFRYMEARSKFETNIINEDVTEFYRRVVRQYPRLLLNANKLSPENNSSVYVHAVFNRYLEEDNSFELLLTLINTTESAQTVRIPPGYTFYCGPKVQPIVMKGFTAQLGPKEVLDPPAAGFCGDQGMEAPSAGDAYRFEVKDQPLMRKLLQTAELRGLDNSAIQDLIWYVADPDRTVSSAVAPVLREEGFLDTNGQPVKMDVKPGRRVKTGASVSIGVDIPEGLRSGTMTLSVDGQKVGTWDIRNRNRMKITHVFRDAGNFLAVCEFTPSGTERPAGVARFGSRLFTVR
jgi:hypothetical protein